MIIGVSRVGEKTYTVNEVALILGTSCSSVTRLLRRGELGGYQFARFGHWRVSHSALVAFCQRTHTPAHFDRLENDKDLTE